MHKNQCGSIQDGCHNVPWEMPFYSRVNIIATPNIGFTLFLFEAQNEQGNSLKYLLGNGPGSLKEQQRNEI